MSLVDNVTNLIGSGNRVLPLRELELEIAAHVGAALTDALLDRPESGARVGER